MCVCNSISITGLATTRTRRDATIRRCMVRHIMGTRLYSQWPLPCAVIQMGQCSVVFRFFRSPSPPTTDSGSTHACTLHANASPTGASAAHHDETGKSTGFIRLLIFSSVSFSVVSEYRVGTCYPRDGKKMFSEKFRGRSTLGPGGRGEGGERNDAATKNNNIKRTSCVRRVRTLETKTSLPLMYI